MKSHKVCSKCKIQKDISRFHKDKYSCDGYKYHCKLCRNDEMQIYRDNNKERIREIQKKTRIKYGEKYLENTRNWKKTKKGKLSLIKSQNKRYRGLKFIPLFYNPFPDDIEVDYHHINDMLVIPLPRKLHQLTSTRKDKHRNQCNVLIQNIYGLCMESLL